MRTRLHVTPGEEETLCEIGDFNGRLYRGELVARLGHGALDRKRQADYRAERKRALTAVTSSRWAGAVTRTAEDQYQLGMRALDAHVRSMDSAIETLPARCALAPTERTPVQDRTKTSGRAVTTHHGAAAAIGRRGLGFKLSRHSNGLRHTQRSVPGQPCGQDCSGRSRVSSTIAH
jgi:hypothetical protein